MNAPNSKRCPHYQMHSEPLEMEGPPSYLAVRRCLLAERLIGFLRQTPEGAALANKMVINAAKNRSFAFIGPDLEAVTQQACTLKRCEERCTPAYSQRLDLFEIDDPNEADVTCNEKEVETQSEMAARLASKRATVLSCGARP